MNKLSNKILNDHDHDDAVLKQKNSFMNIPIFLIKHINQEKKIKKKQQKEKLEPKVNFYKKIIRFYE